MAKITASGDKIFVKLVRTKQRPHARMVSETEEVVITVHGRVLWRYKGIQKDTKTIDVHWSNIKKITPKTEIFEKEKRSWCGKGFKVKA